MQKQMGLRLWALLLNRASGLDFSRRGLAEVSGAAAAGEINLLLVANLSRLGWDLMKVDAYLHWLEDRFVEVVCADGTVPQTATEILHELMTASGVPHRRTQGV